MRECADTAADKSKTSHVEGGRVRVGGCIPQRSYQSVLVLLRVTLEMKTRLCHCCL